MSTRKVLNTRSWLGMAGLVHIQWAVIDVSHVVIKGVVVGMEESNNIWKRRVSAERARFSGIQVFSCEWTSGDTRGWVGVVFRDGGCKYFWRWWSRDVDVETCGACTKSELETLILGMIRKRGEEARPNPEEIMKRVGRRVG